MSKKPLATRQAKSAKTKSPAPKKSAVDIEALQADLRRCKSENLILRAKFNMDEIKKQMITEMSTEQLLQDTMIRMEVELKEYQEANGGTDSINDLKQDLLKAQEKVKTMKSKAKSDTEEINILQQRIRTLEKEYLQMKTEYDNTRGRLPDINDHKYLRKDYEQQIKTLKSKLKETEYQLKKHTTRSVESSLKQRIKELEAILQSAEDSLKTYTDTLPDISNNSSNEEFKNLKAKHDEEVKKNSNISQTLEACKADLDKMTKDRDQTISELATCKENCERLNKQISMNTADNKIKDYMQNEKRLQNDLKQQEECIDKLNNQIEDINMLFKSVSKDQEKHLITENELVKATKELDDLKNRCKKEREKSKEEMTKLKDDHAKHIQSLMQQFSKDSQEMDQELKKARSQQQSSSNHGDQDVQTLKTQLEDEKKAHQNTKSKINDLENKCHDAFESMSKKDKEMKNMETTHKEAMDKKDKTINELRREKTIVDQTGGNSRAELNELKRENDQLKTRLSKMAGDQLMNNNPNITDLSDENRPTKLGEKYSELYDNEWTDAFEDEENESKSEEKAVKSLHKMLLDVHKFCQKESKDHFDRLKKFVRSISDSSTESKDQPDIPVTKLRQLKEIRKSFAADMVESVAEKYIKSKNPSIKGKPNTEKYIQRCVELCWLMSVQDPPVLINDKLTSGLFDGDLFRTYTKTGKTIDFVVWPPLLLHENGPLLCKGVAQGK